MSLRRASAAAALAITGLALGCRSGAPPDLVVITLDTLRADRLGCYGNRGGLTPNLDRVASEGVLFEQASATVPLTLPSHASIFTGRYPDSTGVRNNGSFILPETETTLAEVLKQAGFSTAAVIGAYPLHRRFGLAQGFDLYDEDLPEPGTSALHAMPVFYPERSAAIVTDRAIEAWKHLRGSRRFLWVHYFDPHAPYTPPPPYLGAHPGQPYNDEVEYVDSEMGRLLRTIGQDAPRALLAIVSDHGESLGEHGEKTHGVFLYESTVHVPFLLRAPGLVPRGSRVAAPVSLVDLMPTLLNLLGVPPAAGMEGRELSPAWSSSRLSEAPIYAESYLPRLEYRFSPLTMLRRGSLKYIEAPAPELYDLSRDPGETANLDGGRPEKASLARELADRSRTADRTASARAAGHLDAESEDRLRSLGYAAAGTLAPSANESRGRDPKSMTDYLRRYDRAAGFISSGETEKAIEEFRRLIPEAPENFMARYHLAAALLSSDRLAEAEPELLEVISAAPEFSNGQLMLALVQARLGKIDDAVASFARAAAIAPTSSEPRLALGELLQSVGRFEAAAAAYRAAIEVEPSGAEAPNRLLALRYGRGDLASGIRDLEDLAGRFPRSAALWRSLAAARLRQGDRHGAAEAYRRALALNADDRQASEALRRLGM
jgi:arylsulfatase A-like enzyme/Flp pilus assembly protein TadD